MRRRTAKSWWAKARTPGRADIIDVSLPTAQDHLEQHAAYCRALIGQRCPELSEADIAEAFTIPTEEPDAGAIWT